MAMIIPIRDLRKTSEISEICNKTSEPVFVTKNGYGDLVIMSMKAYNEKMAVLDILHNVQEAEDEIAGGAKLLDGREAVASLKKKYAE